jgi:hypothetical protein
MPVDRAVPLDACQARVPALMGRRQFVILLFTHLEHGNTGLVPTVYY